MSTKKTQKAKPKKPSIPPPPDGWEIVSKDDPRLKNLPCKPRLFIPDYPKLGWHESSYDAGRKVKNFDLDNVIYALPIATQTPAEPAPPMIRLRLPSEKPTKEDGDECGHIVVFYKTGHCCGTWLWKTPFKERVIAWLPGRLPDDILPKPPTSQEELWRKEFEECMAELYDMEMRDGNPDVYSSHYTQSAWDGFLAAKKSTK